MELSVVIPVHNEEENVVPLYNEIRAALDGLMAYEIIFVDDGSQDNTVPKLLEAARDFPHLRIPQHKKACGQSTAVYSGIHLARAPWIATLDGDGQNDPHDLRYFWEYLQNNNDEKLSLIAGVRQKRKDSWVKRKTSKFANWLRQSLLHDKASDTGCGIKMFKRDMFLRFPYFNHMHRYIPALTHRHGGHMVEMAVNHRPRTAGISKYGTFGRAMVGIYDLFGVRWLQNRTKLPDQVFEVER